MTQYVTYDVFTDRPFGGNQLAILPDARGLPEGRLLQITREFGYSETVFLYPPEDAAHTAKARIFTPGGEVPFAGHPTIGTAVMLAQAGAGPDMLLELGIGPLPIRAEGNSASFTNSQPLEVIARPEASLVARALGLSETALKTDPVLASVGLAFTFTELVSRDDLAAISTDIDAFKEGRARHPEGLDFGQAAYVVEGDTIHMRVFAPLDDIPEDPATGSAAAALAALLFETRGAFKAMIHQGDDMGRPSRIEIEARDGSVTVGGSAVLVMQGELMV